MERLPELLEVLEDYELVTIPVEDRAGSSTFDENAAFILLRRRGLGLDTELTLEVTDEREFRVLVDHGGYEQLANLEVRAVDREGTEWSMRPTGEFVQSTSVSARSMLLLFENGARSVELVRGRLPDAIDASELVVRLRNPGLPERFAFARVGDEVRRSLDG